MRIGRTAAGLGFLTASAVGTAKALRIYAGSHYPGFAQQMDSALGTARDFVVHNANTVKDALSGHVLPALGNVAHGAYSLATGSLLSSILLAALAGGVGIALLVSARGKGKKAKANVAQNANTAKKPQVELLNPTPLPAAGKHKKNHQPVMQLWEPGKKT